LCIRAAEVLARADVLLHDALASDAVVALARPGCERIFVGKRGGNHAMPQGEIEALMIARARDGKHVVRLKGGDPFVFGRGGEEAQALHAAGIAFDIVPGISSSIAAPAYAGIPITHRDYNTAFTVVTGHEDPNKPALRQAQDDNSLDWNKLADPRRTLVFLMSMGNLAAIAKHLMTAGLAPDTPAAVIQNGTRPSQRTAVGTLATIASDAEREGLGAPAIVVIGEVVTLREQLQWFDRTPLFGKRVLVTRPARQAEDFVRVLYARGVEPILASTIAIVAPDDPHPAHRAIDDLANYGWIVFTSQNGVDAFFERLTSLDADTRYIGKTKVAAIGSKTARRLHDFGVRADIVPSVYVSEEIGRTLIETTHLHEKVLIFGAQDARDALHTMLEDAGRDVHVVAAYKTIFEVDPDFAEKAARADVLTFTSASTVRGFAELLGGNEAACAQARGKLVACIGSITADAADAIGLHVDVVADISTTDGLLDALEAHLTLVGNL